MAQTGTAQPRQIGRRSTLKRYFSDWVGCRQCDRGRSIQFRLCKEKWIVRIEGSLRDDRPATESPARIGWQSVSPRGEVAGIWLRLTVMTRIPWRVLGSIKLNGCSAVESARHATNETIVADWKVGASSPCWMYGAGSRTPRLGIQDDLVICARVGGVVAVQSRVRGIALLDRNHVSGVEPGTASEPHCVPSRSRGGWCRLSAERGRIGGGARPPRACDSGEGTGHFLDCRRTAAAFSWGRGKRGAGGTRIR